MMIVMMVVTMQIIEIWYYNLSRERTGLPSGLSCEGASRYFDMMVGVMVIEVKVCQ